MDRCSFFIENKALFGGYPTQESVEELENNGVRYFIDLTCTGERKITPYTTKYTYAKYPIRDHNVPSNWKTFSRFILRLCTLLKKLNRGELIYIHCKGGHGRSGIVVACILCYLYKIQPSEALELTNQYHSNRKEMREKRRRMGSPPGEFQKDFVKRFFRPLYFYKTHNATTGLSTFSVHSVKVPGMGVFPTAESAFQAHKDPSNEEYVRKQESTFNPTVSKKLGKKIIREDWDEVKERIMYKILTLKFQQHDGIKQNLLNTGLRPIVECGPDPYWSNGKDGRGRNTIGKLLVKIRNRMYVE